MALKSPQCILYAHVPFEQSAKLERSEVDQTRFSPRAIEISVYIIRAFVRLRQLLASHEELAKRFDELEAKTNARFRQLFEAIRQLMTPTEMKKRVIGFVREEK